MARGGHTHWLRRERGPGLAALIGQRSSAEPGNPASRWGKWGRDWTHPELRAQEPQVGARQIGVRRPEPGPGGKGPAPGRVGAGPSTRDGVLWPCTQGAKNGASSPRIGALILSRRGSPPPKREGLSPPREQNTLFFPSEMGSSS